VRAEAETETGLDAVLEPLALTAWPAAEREERGGWVLRAHGGVTRRANSAWTGRATGDAPVEARIEAVERWYAAHGLPALFQLPPHAAPDGLDEALAARGYRREAPVVVMAGRERLVARADTTPGGAPFRTVLEETPSDAWLDLATGARGLTPERRRLYRDIVARAPRPAAFALTRAAGAADEGAPGSGGALGCGLGIVQGTWLHVAAMATRPAARRRGVARALLEALFDFGRRHGARGAWLQVERENAAARTLYTGAGLHEAYALHYRRAPTR
jgi:ribosomal protein S18 acetylase RimI-like enzyme